MGRTLTALVDALTPPQASDDETDRARFLVQIWLLLLAASIAFVPLNLMSKMWGQLALMCFVFVAAGSILFLLRRSVKLVIVTHASLVTLTLTFGASALMQTPADISNLLTLVLVPLIASYLLVRHSFIWVVAASATGAAALTLASHGITVPVNDPEPVASAAFNIAVNVIASWVLTRRFDQLRSNSLERMRQADRAKTTFLATIGHEIRTPMNGVLGMTEVMLQEPQSPTQRDQLEVIQRSGRGLVSLINDLLDLTRLEARKLDVDDAPFDLDALIKDLEVLARGHATAKGLALVLERGPSIPRIVLGDGMRLTQVLNNLVNNAIKFTDAGEVRICVKMQGGKKVRFEVRDSGIGITPEVLKRLFRPFEQADGSSTRRHGGTGLGLAISSQLVTLMGGRIEVESEPGKGSTFGFTLPCTPAVLPAPKVIAPLVMETRSRRVLVVDDNPINLRVASSLVEKAGFVSLRATSGREALELMSAGDVALVLMDCHMPEMDGFEATERIRRMPLGLQLPIVALTASATPDDVEACRRAGMNEVLAKPIHLDTLREVLARLLGN
ncbi:MAG: ATP-binding protein [Archangium sp.]|nr:ATP-binding protein [Archangium sp.]MDP3154559.1 ATP-binding protein [Archangium sp.]MDP3569402.1 ATP-binding protein [Archangium sp.]